MMIFPKKSIYKQCFQHQKKARLLRPGIFYVNKCYLSDNADMSNKDIPLVVNI